MKEAIFLVYKNTSFATFSKIFKPQILASHLQVPKCFIPVQIFWASAKIDLRIVPVTNLLCQTKIWFTFSKFGFCASTKSFEPALNAIQLLVYPKIFTSTKHSRTCRRTRHKFWAFFLYNVIFDTFF